MKIWEKDQELAQKTGGGIWLWEGTWYELYIDNDDEWSANVSWGPNSDDNTLYILSMLLKEGTRIDQRHLDAIQRVDAPA